jgi:hypothetical protein
MPSLLSFIHNTSETKMGYYDYDAPTRVELIQKDIKEAAERSTAAVAIREISDHRYDLASAIWVLTDTSYHNLDDGSIQFLVHTIEKIDEMRAHLREFLNPYFWDKRDDAMDAERQENEAKRKETRKERDARKARINADCAKS